jgi:hypothetical protein
MLCLFVCLFTAAAMKGLRDVITVLDSRVKCFWLQARNATARTVLLTQEKNA